MGLYERSISESSDDIQIEPLQFCDLKRRLEDENEEEANWQNASPQRFFSSVMGLKRKKGHTLGNNNTSLVKMAWKNAAMKALALGDPWEKFHLNDYTIENAKRHRYNALKQCWVADTVRIKMEPNPFNHGAMRECFRMKKLSNFAKKDGWKKAHNYVAKRYINTDVPRQTYFDDVKLQMDAKLWGEEYNRHNPPKKVDIFQMAILEMIDRAGSPLYHVEHYIEGKYVKYNSNSGFVRSEALRMTPQSFSHFTFERSGHELIVVDIQGVGDLYTDPQIHTASGSDYGEGNLGTRGMALFFHSHICNSICESLLLTQFDLFPSEITASSHISKAQRSCKTAIRGKEEHVILPTEDERGHIQECIRLRSLSSGYLSGEERERIDSIGSIESVDSFDDLNPHLDSDYEDSASEKSINKPRRMPRIRYDSTTDFGDNTESKEEALKNFKEMVERKARPSCIMNQVDHEKMLEEMGDAQAEELEHNILGQIHLDLARYHELNRFVEENESYDKDAALFHVKYAAKCGLLDAALAISQINLGLPHDILPDIELDEDERDVDDGFKYLRIAAEAGDRGAMIKLAKAFDNGSYLPDGESLNWTLAIHWYSKCVEKQSGDKDGNYDAAMDDPNYLLIGRQAEMYWQGGNLLPKDPNKAGELFTTAADLATEAMKGKLASKYYMKAEEAWAEVEEED